MTLIAWILFCITDGMSDAFMYNVKNPDKKNRINEHIIFTIKRATVFGTILLFTDTHLWETALVLLMVQPFFHNNTYYITRHALDKSVYEYSLLNQSKTSTAFLTKIMHPMVRLTLMWFGIILYLSCL